MSLRQRRWKNMLWRGALCVCDFCHKLVSHGQPCRGVHQDAPICDKNHKFATSLARFSVFCVEFSDNFCATQTQKEFWDRSITPFRYYYRTDATPNQNCMRYLIRVKQITNLGPFSGVCVFGTSGQHRPGVEKFRMTVGLVLWVFLHKIKYSEYNNSCHQNSIGEKSWP